MKSIKILLAAFCALSFSSPAFAQTTPGTTGSGSMAMPGTTTPGSTNNPNGTITNPNGRTTNPNGTLNTPSGTLTTPGTTTTPGTMNRRTTTKGTMKSGNGRTKTKPTM